MRVGARMLKLIGDGLQFLHREEHQLIWIDSLLARALDALQEKFDLMRQCSDLLIFFFQRLCELFRYRGVLSLRLGLCLRVLLSLFFALPLSFREQLFEGRILRAAWCFA